MKTLQLVLMVIAIGALAGCKEEEKKEEPKISIEGFTVRDGNGNLVGNVDPADWNLNTTFNNMENALFPEDNLPVCSDHVDTAYQVFVYPNPNDGIFVFGSIVPREHVSLRIVDEYMNVLYKKDSLTSTTLTITEDKDAGLRAVRLYYRVYRDSCKYQGYGDIGIF